MHRAYQFKDFRRFKDDESFVDIYVGERCFAHIARARYLSDGRHTVTIYNEDMTTRETFKAFSYWGRLSLEYKREFGR